MDYHKKRKRKPTRHHHSSKIPLWLKILLGILLLLFVLAGAAYGYVQHTLGKIHKVEKESIEMISPEEETFETDADLSEAEGEVLSPEEVQWPDMEADILQDKDVINIMLIGQDKREGQSRQRSDTMILATINMKKKSLQLTSFMRDLYVQIPGYSDNRMNAAYQFGGMELLDQVIEKNFGIHIDGNVEVDFNGFQKCIDMLGGIELELSQAEADYICGKNQNVLYPQSLREDWSLTEGMNHLNGEQALIHARNRSIGNSDYRRTERQRDVVMAAFNKAKGANITTMLSLVDEGFSLLTTDMSHGEIMGYAMNVLRMGVTGMESYRIPQDGAYTPAVIRQMQVLVPDLEKNREYLQEVLY